MAFSVRLTGFAVQSGKQIFRMEPPWWPANVLREDPRMKETIEDGYLDFKATLSAEEVRAIHERFRQDGCRGVFGSEQWQAIICPMIVELDAVFCARAAEFGEFEICVFEWESGLE